MTSFMFNAFLPQFHGWFSMFLFVQLIFFCRQTCTPTIYRHNLGLVDQPECLIVIHWIPVNTMTLLSVSISQFGILITCLYN